MTTNSKETNAKLVKTLADQMPAVESAADAMRAFGKLAAAAVGGRIHKIKVQGFAYPCPTCGRINVVCGPDCERREPKQ